MSGEFAGRIALVTGGGKGVGRAVGMLLASRGAHVILNYFHSPEAAAATVDEIRAHGGGAEAIRASVGQEASVAQMFDTIAARHGGLDILVNNASRGVGPTASLVEAEWTRAFAVNFHGSRWCAAHAARLMARRGGGAIVNVSAAGSSWVLADYAAGGTAKAAVESLTRYLAVEYAPLGIRVNAASASVVDSSTLTKFPQGRALGETAARATPLGRLASEREFAELIAFLASDRSSYITGQTVLADGGLTLSAAALSPSGRVGPQHPPAVPPVSGPVDTSSLVAIVGTGIVVPNASGPEEFWQRLCDGKGGFTEPGDRWPLEHFWSEDTHAPDRTYSRVAGFVHDFRPHPALAEEEATRGAMADEAARWLRHALLQAKDTVTSRPGDRQGLYIGAWPGGSQALAGRIVTEMITRRAKLPPGKRHELRDLLQTHYPRALEERLLPDRMIRRAAEGILDRVTESVVVDTACSSSLYTVDFGVKALLANECDIAYCGGVEALEPTSGVLFAKLNGLSPTGRVHSLDRRANGTLFSDGAGVVALKLLTRALEDRDEILGIVTGFGGAADGRGKSIAAPNPQGQIRAVRRARAVNGTPAESVSWMLAHATGTPTGDRSEAESLGALAPGSGYLCTSNKAVIGHTGWAAGAVSLVHALESLKRERILAQPGLTDPPEGTGERVVVPATDQAFPRSADHARTVGISAFGFGGTNGHLLISDRVIHEGLRSAPPRRNEDIVLVAWSAHLPGGPDHAEVSRWLRGDGPPPATVFGDAYPYPLPADTRLLPRTMRSIDRCQLMAIEVTGRFLSEHGELWADVRETTGVFAAHTGPPRRLAESTLRCHADRVTALLSGADPAVAAGVRTVLNELRAHVPASDEDTQPGVMTNVIASRIAARFDLHGPTMVVDAGEDSTLAALKAAERYLHTGELDLALVLALNGNSTNELAAITGDPPGTLAEGAFLLAVTTADRAAEAHWPVLSRLRLSLPAAPDTAAARQERPREPGYLAAQGALAVLRATERASGDVEIPPVRHPATTVRVLPEPARSAGAHRTQRYEQRLVPAPETTPAPVADDRGGVLLTDSNPCARRYLDRGATVLTTDPVQAPPGAYVVTDLDDAGTVERVLAQLDAADTAVTVISEFTGPGRSGPEVPPPSLLRLHELLLLAVQRLWPRWTTGSSLGVLLTGQTEALRPHPHAALFTGFVKSLARERPRCAVFALLTDESPERAMELLESERVAPRTSPVVWHLGGRRHVETLVPTSLPEGPALPVTEDSVVLVTGGTGGITTAMLRALARHVRPHLWLLGRTDISELAPYEGLWGEPQQPVERRTVIQWVREKEELPLRSAIAKADRLLRADEVRTARDALSRRYGVDRVHYLACDLRDRASVRRAVATVRAESGSVDIVVHGAGVSMPAALAATGLDGFRAVRDTKIMGYHHLKQALAEHPPAVWCNIGSATGTYGVTGDTAYAGANDYLAAASLRPAASGTQEVTVAFPWWAESGFASAGLNRDYLERQGILTPVTDQEGTRIFLTELANAGSGGVGTYLGRRERCSFAVERPGYIRKPDDGGYLRGNADDGRRRFRFDPVRDAYLDHHLVDGKPTVPGTLMLEIAAEAAERAFPGLVTHGFREASFEAFIKPYAGRAPLELTVTAIPAAPDGLGRGMQAVDVTITSEVSPNAERVPRSERRHFRTRVLVGPARPPQYAPSGETPVDPAEGTPVADPYYHPDSPVWLRGIFHNTADSRVSGTGAAWSTWSPSADGPAVLDARRIPFLMLCATLRTVALTSAPGGRQPVYVPRAIRRIDLGVPAANDVELTHHYGRGIRLSTSGDGAFHARAQDGTPLLEITGVTMAAMGSAPAGPPDGTGSERR